MLRRSITLLVWALVGWMGVALALRLGGSGAAVPAAEVSPSAVAAPNLARLFGAARAEAPVALAPADSRFQLLGVVAPGDGRSTGGVALLAIDNGPPKAYRVGERVDDGLTLTRVLARSAVLTDAQGGERELTLQSPAPEAAAVGVLPPAAPMVAPTAVPMPGVAPLPAGAQPGGAGALPGLPLRRQGADPGPAEAPRVPDDEAGPRRPALPAR